MTVLVSGIMDIMQNVPIQRYRVRSGVEEDSPGL